MSHILKGAVVATTRNVEFTESRYPQDMHRYDYPNNSLRIFHCRVSSIRIFFRVYSSTFFPNQISWNQDFIQVIFYFAPGGPKVLRETQDRLRIFNISTGGSLLRIFNMSSGGCLHLDLGLHVQGNCWCLTAVKFLSFFSFYSLVLLLIMIGNREGTFSQVTLLYTLKREWMTCNQVFARANRVFKKIFLQGNCLKIDCYGSDLTK